MANRPGAPVESLVQARAGDARALLGAGTALLLQVGHPTVAAGVREHSDFERDPWGRLLRTLDFLNLLVYGGPDRAAETGRRLREGHRAIRGTAPDGTRYHALEPAAYAWVHATLAEAILAAHARFGIPFTASERERFWSEWRALGAVLGVGERDLPPTYAGFRAWVDETVATVLQDSDVVRSVLRALAARVPPPVPVLGRPRAWGAVRVPAAHAMRVATAGLLTPAARARLAVPWTPAMERELTLLGAGLRAATPVLPPVARCLGPCYLRWRAPQIERGPFGTRRSAAASD